VAGEPAAIVELAQASGLDLLDRGVPAPLTACSYGTGELVRHALDRGARYLVLGVGGSASTDGGAGLLRALGARLLDREGHALRPGGGDLARLDHVDLSALDPRLLEVRCVLASDVDAPLLGPTGAAQVYAPQKGADPRTVDELERALGRFADALARATGRDARAQPGAGAAGGAGLAALGVLGATRRPGIDVMLELTRFAQVAEGATLVVTGEGSFDEQSLAGKTPVGVVRVAGSLQVPVAVIAGRCRLSRAEWTAVGVGEVATVEDVEPDAGRQLSDAGSLVERIAAGIGERTGRGWRRPP
jgi:glycerate kinase